MTLDTDGHVRPIVVGTNFRCEAGRLRAGSFHSMSVGARRWRAAHTARGIHLYAIIAHPSARSEAVPLWLHGKPAQPKANMSSWTLLDNYCHGTPVSGGGGGYWEIGIRPTYGFGAYVGQWVQVQGVSQLRYYDSYSGWQYSAVLTYTASDGNTGYRVGDVFVVTGGGPENMVSSLMWNGVSFITIPPHHLARVGLYVRTQQNPTWRFDWIEPWDVVPPAYPSGLWCGTY